MAAALLLRFRSREPSYEGRPLSHWLENYKSPDPQKAKLAIQSIGTNALPILLKKLAARESVPFSNVLARMPDKWAVHLHLPTLQTYSTKIDHDRIAASEGISSLGHEAKAAIPGLVKLCSDANLRVRYCAVYTLRCLGPEAAETLPLMINCLKDPEWEIRDEAVQALGTFGCEPEKVVPLLERVVKEQNSKHPFIRADAIDSLAEFGINAASAVPFLVQSLDDPVIEIRKAATNALKKISPGTVKGRGMK